MTHGPQDRHQLRFDGQRLGSRLQVKPLGRPCPKPNGTPGDGPGYVLWESTDLGPGYGSRPLLSIHIPPQEDLYCQAMMMLTTTTVAAVYLRLYARGEGVSMWYPSCDRGYCHMVYCCAEACADEPRNIFIQCSAVRSVVQRVAPSEFLQLCSWCSNL